MTGGKRGSPLIRQVVCRTVRLPKTVYGISWPKCTPFPNPFAFAGSGKQAERVEAIVSWLGLASDPQHSDARGGRQYRDRDRDLGEPGLSSDVTWSATRRARGYVSAERSNAAPAIPVTTIGGRHSSWTP
jgi:hypothetical protein